MRSIGSSVTVRISCGWIAGTPSREKGRLQHFGPNTYSAKAARHQRAIRSRRRALFDGEEPLNGYELERVSAAAVAIVDVTLRVGGGGDRGRDAQDPTAKMDGGSSERTRPLGIHEQD